MLYFLNGLNEIKKPFVKAHEIRTLVVRVSWLLKVYSLSKIAISNIVNIVNSLDSKK
ncbi:hypothetical protein M595_2006 [Lyngbya aestuarii BL J]|uniref:Uncharacterized protein n=1 Tax=Lyngbya aestuarii BL J TaxID=1348334 RepID=U7QNQ2_9CYAN|nr:hypothetical protein M595_2006 [Lyngbya aestuarii BL J]